jgi:hypothetical protein
MLFPAAGLVAALALPASAGAATAGFGTPGTHSFTVPAGVTALRISASGGGGGRSGSTTQCTPGGGAAADGVFSVTPGEVLAIVVAGRGNDGSSVTSGTANGGTGGIGGGGTGGTGSGGVSFAEGGGGGGGASRATGPGGPLLVAAGGGGCGAFPSGGDLSGNGGNDGSAGAQPQPPSTARPGAAGTTSGGGAGGASANALDPSGGNGSAGQGGLGAGTSPQNGGGGGGGGGLFGGGGGGGVRSGETTAAGGGGGGDFVATGALSFSIRHGANAGNGSLSITYVGTPGIFGKAEVGKTLQVTPGAGSDATATYQWLRSSPLGYVAIAGATGTSYKLTKADRGKRIEVRETLAGVPATSAPTAVVGPPITHTKVKKTQRVIKQKGLILKVRSNVAATLTATATTSLPRGAAKVLRFKRLKKSLKRAGHTYTLRIKLSKKGLATLKRALPGHKLKAKVVLTLKDKAGGKSTTKLTVKLKR